MNSASKLGANGSRNFRVRTSANLIYNRVRSCIDQSYLLFAVCEKEPLNMMAVDAWPDPVR